MKESNTVKLGVRDQSQSNSKARLITLPIFLLLIYIVCTYFPLIYIYFPFLGKMRIVLLAGIALVISYVVARGDYTNLEAYRSSIFFTWLGFLTVLVASLLVSLDRGLTLNLIFVNIKYFIVFMVMVKIIDNNKRIDLLLCIFSACAVGMAVNTILNYLVFGQTLGDSYRAMAIESGIFGDPNDLCLFFNTCLPFLLYFFVKGKRKLIPFLGTIAIITAVILTYSRGGFLGLLAVGVGFYMFFARKNKKYLLLILVLAVVFWFLAPEAYKERISTITQWEVDEETGMTGTRMDSWRLVLKEGIKHPILGSGAGCSTYLGGRAMSDWHATHNSFIQVFVETGLFGLCFYILLFFLPYKQYRSLVRQASVEGNLYFIRFRLILVSFGSYATTVFFLPQAYSPILYTLTGIAVIQTQLISQKQPLE
jgi:O-antigen ligase